MPEYNTYILETISERPLVLLVTLIGFGALGAGMFSLTAPSLALQIYGISPDPMSPSNSSKKHSSVQAYEPILRALSIRNFTLGLSILALTSYWQNVTEQDAAAGRVVQRCLGYVIMVGSVVPLIDAYGAFKDGSSPLRRSATLLHCFRSCAWIAGGVWCLKDLK